MEAALPAESLAPRGLGRGLFVGIVSGLAAAVQAAAASGEAAAHGAAAAFLGQRGADAFTSRTCPPSADLLEELESVVGREHRQFTEGRLGPLEEALRPLVDAMPKEDASGSLGSAAVRYVLHRFFVQRYGWFVRGLDAAGEAWNSSSPASVFGAHTGTHAGVQGLFENHLGSDEFGLRQVAVFAATLESLVHAERAERLQSAYQMLGLSEHHDVSESEALEAINYYMLMYVLDLNYSSSTRAEVDEAFSTVLDTYPSWPETVRFVHQTRQTVLASKEGSRTEWGTMMVVLEEVGNKYGHWQNRECRGLKNALVQLDESGTGRVALESFYKSALSGSWQFLESPSYLRQLGALDDSDPARINVIIPNYVNSPTNCLASSKFYSVCCIDECHGLLGHLERSLGVPEAEPERIVDVVAGLRSETVAAPRVLPASLVRRLHGIAARHAGRVPLHGRLFAQWMHHAYPRECSYPHLSGTTKPQPPMLWMKETGEDVVASEDEMRRLVESSGRRGLSGVGGATQHDRVIDGEASEGDLPWSFDEELFISRPPPRELEPRWSLTLAGIGRVLLLFAATCSFGLMVIRSLVVMDAFAGHSQAKHFL